jgi:hypothetical protein
MTHFITSLPIEELLMEELGSTYRKLYKIVEDVATN